MSCSECGNEISIRSCVFCRYKEAKRQMWIQIGCFVLLCAGISVMVLGSSGVRLAGGIVWGFAFGYSTAAGRETPRRSA